MMIRVVLPAHLRGLAKVGSEISLDVREPVTLGTVLDAVESQYPALCGTIRDHVTRKRRPLVRFFANGADYSHQPADAAIPDAVITGDEPFIILGAIAGG